MDVKEAQGCIIHNKEYVRYFILTVNGNLYNFFLMFNQQEQQDSQKIFILWNPDNLDSSLDIC